MRIVDGDSITIRIGTRTETVRYIGMNTPELHHPTKGEQPGGREAAKANGQLVEGQTVRLELDVQGRDPYGRMLAYVYVGDIMVNAELVAQGFAQVMTVHPNVKHQELFLKLEREARFLHLGLWRGAGPPAPERGASSTPPPQVAQTRPGVPPLRCLDVPSYPPHQRQLHDLLGRTLHLPHDGRVFLWQDEVRAVLCDGGGCGEGRLSALVTLMPGGGCPRS